jgi:thiol-disulfide isomerase/thioredoxin
MAVRAPDFRTELDWANTGGRHLTLADFRGRVLVLDFWTYGCINCLHMIPELEELERLFPDEVAVVGVHSGKFTNERGTANISRACERLGVTHPVLNDRQFRTWREYAVGAWPTLVIVSPTGYVLAQHAGEIEAEQLAAAVEKIVVAAREQGALVPSYSLPSGHDEQEPHPGVLRFPAGVHAAEDGRVFVSDTGNHRVLEIALEGEDRGRVVRVIGTGDAGFLDGPADEAELRSPHGLALVGTTLYVADTGNHLVRAVDLERDEVATVAGTGWQARPVSPAGPARETALNSPWDLLWDGETLVVAMAGNHQLWRIGVDSAHAAPYVGSGAEELHDGPLAMAALAQPSALASDGRVLWWADPESSAIRRAGPGDETATLVGTGLFDFGDRDGVGEEARLQHPQGLAWWAEGGALLVADTYNHRIKRLDPATREVRSLAGSGEAGREDGEAEEARFWEPGGIAVLPGGEAALVADTNNHALRRISLETGRVTTVRLE